MSRKTKRHPGHRTHRHDAATTPSAVAKPSLPSGETPPVAVDKEVAGEIMSALLNAITFGALDAPASGGPERTAEAPPTA